MEEELHDRPHHEIRKRPPLALGQRRHELDGARGEHAERQRGDGGACGERSPIGRGHGHAVRRPADARDREAAADVEPARDVVDEAIVAVRDAMEGSRVQVEDPILEQPQHANLLGDAGEVRREDHLRQQPGPTAVAVMVDEVARGHVRRAGACEVTEDRERRPGAGVQEEPRQHAGATPEVEQAAAGERASAHGQPRVADLRPGLGVGGVDELRARPPPDGHRSRGPCAPVHLPVARLDHRHRKPLPRELTRRGQAGDSSANHEHVVRGLSPTIPSRHAGHAFCPTKLHVGLVPGCARPSTRAHGYIPPTQLRMPASSPKGSVLGSHCRARAHRVVTRPSTSRANNRTRLMAPSW